MQTNSWIQTHEHKIEKKSSNNQTLKLSERYTTDHLFISNVSNSTFKRSASTLAGHADRLITRLADTVIEGGAARLGGVLGVRAGQAGAHTSWCSHWFKGSRWACCSEEITREKLQLKTKYFYNLNISKTQRDACWEKLDDGRVKMKILLKCKTVWGLQDS